MDLLLFLALQVDFTKWELARERVGHKVTADVALAAPAAEELKIVVVYFDRDLELKRSKLITVAKGQSAFKVEVEQLPNFSRYEAYVQAGATTRVFYSGDLLKPPTAKKADPAKLAVDGAGPYTVRNTGGLPAAEPTLVFKELRVRLGDVLPAATEETYEVDAPGPAVVVWKTGDGPSGGGIATARYSDGSTRVTGEFKNTQAGPVEKVVLTLKLGAGSHTLPLPGGLKPGESRPFELWVPGSFDAVSYDVAFAEAKEAVAPPPAPRPQARRLSTKPLETAGPALPKPQEEKKDVEPKGPALSAELRGLMMVEGVTAPKSGKYSGDVYFLRVAFTDAAGKAAKPAGTFQIAMLEAGKDPWKVQRIVTAATWKIDAAKLNAQTADPAVMAWDKKTDELWIGLLRTDRTPFAAALEMQLTVKEQGTWHWKALGDPWTAPARGPDKK